MKTIVISGARSDVGKTTLAEKIGGVLPGSVIVKLGHGEEKDCLLYTSDAADE